MFHQKADPDEQPQQEEQYHPFSEAGKGNVLAESMSRIVPSGN